MKSAMKRDKEATKQRLIEAVGQIIAEQGFEGIGVNAVARVAGVDKVLIYRYFGDLDGLLQAFIAQTDYLTNIERFLGGKRSIRSKTEANNYGKQLLIKQLRQMRKSKELQEILLWGLAHKNAVTDAVAESREQQASAMLADMRRVIDFDTIDVPALGALLFAGVCYLVLRSRQIDTTYNGVDLSTEEGWQRIEQAIVTILDRVIEGK